MGKPEQLSDAELITGSVDELGLFGELYERNADAVLAFFVRRTGCAQTAADLTAETFAQALTSRHRLVDMGAPDRAWLFKIANRQLGRFVRHERVSSRATQRLGMERVVLQPADLERVEQLVDLAPVQAALHEAVSELPEKQASALRLRIADGLPYPEVARRLGCSEAAGRVRVGRGLARLTELIGDPA